MKYQTALRAAIVATTSCALAPMVSATPFDSLTYSGQDPRENHVLGNAGNDYCSGICLAGGGVGAESFAVFQVDNPTSGIGSVPIAETIVCTDASGNVVTDSVAQTPANVRLKEWLNGLPAAGWPELDLVAAYGQRWAKCELETDPEGKIIGGYLQQFIDTTAVGGGPACGIYDLTERRLMSLQSFSGVDASGNPITSADSCDITVEQVRAVVTDGDYAGFDFANFAFPNGTIVNVSGPIAVGTCDPLTAGSDCGGSAKAVPVPAFAAASLGLGLVGVTLLTRGRKRVA